MADIFISYSRSDRPRAAEIREALAALELSVWYDAGIAAGASFDREIEREVGQAKAVLVLWSEAAVASDWVRNEARTGKERDALVAVQLEACQLPLEFRSIQAEVLAEGAPARGDTAWLGLLDRIGALVGRPGLASFARLRAGAQPAEWRRWLASHPSDPLVSKAVESMVDAASPGLRDELNRERTKRTALEAELAEHVSAANAQAGELTSAAREAATLRRARDLAEQRARDAEAEAERLRAEAGDGRRALWERGETGSGIRLDQRLAYYVAAVLWLFVVSFLAEPVTQLNQGYAGTDDIFWLVVGLVFLATPAMIVTIKILRRRAAEARAAEATSSESVEPAQ